MAQLNQFISQMLQTGKNEAEITEFLKSKGHSENDIHNAFLGGPETPSTLETGLQKAQIKPPLTTGQYLRSFLPNTIEDAISNLGDLTRMGASAATGGIATVLGGGPIAGNLTYSATDQALRAATGKGTGSLSGTENPVLAGLEDAALGMAGEKILPAVGRMAKETIRPGSVVGTSAKNIGGTYSRYFPEGEARKSKFIEENLNRKQNTRRVNEIAANAKKETERIIFETTGKTVNLDTSNEILAKEFNTEIKNQFYTSVNASDQAGEASKIIASANPHTFQRTVTAASQGATTVLGPNGQQIPINIPAKTVAINIEGPVELQATIKKAKNFVDNYTPTLGEKDPNAPLYNHAQSILNMANAEYDDLGNLISWEPIGFEQAWDWKKSAGNLAFNSEASDLDHAGSLFGELFKSIDDDIINSANTWQVDGRLAVQSYTDAKDIVNQRHQIFTPRTPFGRGTRLLIDNIDPSGDQKMPVFQELNRRLSDPILLQKTLDQDSFTLPTGVKVESSNMRRSLMAYDLKRKIQGATVYDASGNAVFEPEKLWTAYKNPQMREAQNKLYGSTNRTKYEQFFKDLSYSSQKQGAQRTMFNLRPLAGTIGLGGGLLAGFQTGNPYLGVGVAALYPMGKGLSFLLNNKHTGRVLAAAAKGGPLGMSNQAASRIISRALVGKAVKLLMNDGSTQDATVDKNGDFQDLEQ